MRLVSQFTAELNGEMFNAFRFEDVDAATEQLAKARVRAWARKEFPTARPTEVKVLDSQREGKAQTRISEFVPESFKRNSYTVEIGVKS